MVYCLLLSLLTGKVWAALMHLFPYLITFRSPWIEPYMETPGMESYIIQLDFSAAFDRVSHSGLLFKLNSIGISGSVLSICTEFLSDRRQRVLVDDAASEWITIISGMPQWSVLSPLLFILYTSEMFQLVDDRLFAYADDSTLLAVIRKSADRPAVAASLNLTRTWLGFRSGAITEVWNWILTKVRL